MFGLFTKAVVPDPSPSVNPLAVVARMFRIGISKASTTYGNVVAAEKAMQHPVTYRCLDKLGLTVQSVKWYAAPDDDATATERNSVKKSHVDALNRTLKRPNPGMTGSQLKYWMTLSYACYGKVIVKVSVMADGRINGIYPLDVAITELTFDRFGQIAQFTYGNSGSKETIRSLSSARRDESGMIVENFAFMIMKPNLGTGLEMDKQNTPLKAIGTPSAVYEALMQRAFDTARGAPNSRWLVTADKDLDADQADAVKDAIDDAAPGGDESGRVLFIAGTNIKITEMKNDMTDIQSKLPADDMARTIAGAFGIPIALLGLAGADGAKFANNYDESRKTFFEDTIEPGYLSPFEEGFTLALCMAGLKVLFDRDSIPAIRDKRAETAQKYDAINFLTENEKREATGWPATADTTTTPTGTTTDD